MADVSCAQVLGTEIHPRTPLVGLGGQHPHRPVMKGITPWGRAKELNTLMSKWQLSYDLFMNECEWYFYSGQSKCFLYVEVSTGKFLSKYSVTRSILRITIILLLFRTWNIIWINWDNDFFSSISHISLE